jgi:glycine/D-amino acid oxidase-like deaminating enzyme
LSPPSRTRYNTSLWNDTASSSGGKAPARFSGTAQTDVVVVGGGLTGAVVSAVFARAGIDVVVVDAGQPGESAGLDAGWIVEGPGVAFRDLQDRYGLKVARRAFEVTRRSALDAAAFLRRLGGGVDLDGREVLQLATTTEQARHLEREYQARAAAGLEASWLPARRAAGDSRADDVVAALKTHSEGVVDPQRACRRLLTAATRAGARLFGRTEVTRVRPRRRDVEVVTAGGSLAAQAVVLATAMPRPLVPALQRHVRVDDTYIVATDVLPAALARRIAPRAILRDTLLPGRPVGLPPLSSDLCLGLTLRGRLLVQGGTRPAVAPRLRDAALVQRTGQLMYELSRLYPDISGVLPAYAWTARRVTGRDGLPIVGSHRGFPRHLFAVGLGGTGLAGAWMAARILLRSFTGEAEAGDDLFGFARLQ